MDKKRRICIERDGVQEFITIEEWEKMSGTSFSTVLEFEKLKLRDKIQKKTKKLYEKGQLTRQQVWFGSYFKKEIEEGTLPDVVLRYINPALGWGVFARRKFKKMEFIAEYSGLLRKSKRSDRENAYCFEHTFSSGVKTPYTIDAQEKGGIGRLVNHGTFANLQSSLATIDFLSHVVLITNKEIEAGEQLVYDYGPDYWSKRESPIDVRKV